MTEQMFTVATIPPAARCLPVPVPSAQRNAAYPLRRLFVSVQGVSVSAVVFPRLWPYASGHTPLAICRVVSVRLRSLVRMSRLVSRGCRCPRFMECGVV